MNETSPVNVVDSHVNPAEVVTWVEQQDVESQERCAVQIFDHLLAKAAQPKSVSGNACARLCGFVDQSSKAKSPGLSSWAHSHSVTLQLFTFYVEWNESDHHRSMKLVLDLIIHLLKNNPSRPQALSTQKELVASLVSIVIGKSSKPVVKSAIKTLDHFLTKRLITTDELKASYLALNQDALPNDDQQAWHMFFAELFRWIWVPFVCPTAGRFIVCLLEDLRKQNAGPSTATWHSWLLAFVAEDITIIESIKNYIFLPLFKADKPNALLFLRQMNEQKPVSSHISSTLDIPALLQLAALEVGKKVGLVEDPGIGVDDSDKATSPIILHEEVLESVLAHPSHEVRALALSLLITSPSTIRPYSVAAFDLLKRHLGAYFADADAKFRVDVTSRVRDMFKRLRGAISVLKRSIPRAKAKANKSNAAPGQSDAAAPQAITYRSNLIALPESVLVHCLNYHLEFLRWYINFLCDELIPTASYQRHITSLKAIVFIFRLEAESTKTWETPDDQEIFFNLFGERWIRSLFDLVMDPFDDVRDASSAALKLIFKDTRYKNFSLFSSGGKVSPTKELEELFRRATDVARRTSRADHSDGAARANQLRFTFLDAEGQRVLHLTELIQELDRKLALAESDLGQAVLEAPLHSDFASLSYIWQVISEVQFSEAELHAVEALQDRLVSCCERAWAAVKDTLCVDSPEGHITEDLEEADIDTKSLLSYSFRAIHESSNFMRTILATTRNRTREGFVTPSYHVFEKIGNLSFTQLASLRHRGAFTTVSATFATCCQQSKHLDKDTAEQPILKTWYNGTLDVIFTQTSTTRRSAGIPSMMTGVLSANAPSLPFEQVMDRLIEIASMQAQSSQIGSLKLPQVHAYNCLKDIFKNSLLTSMGNKSEKYLPQCLELAASGLKSEVWAIRNCGLIFLRSLIDCLFGSHESKSMIEAGWDGKANRIAYHRYPNLPQVLLNLLKSGLQTIGLRSMGASAAESVFPALDIIRRAGPPDLLRDELQVIVAKYLANSVWHVRELAARTLCSCLLHKNWFRTMKAIFHDALEGGSKANKNHVHGVLLAAKFALERLSEVAVDYVKADLPNLAELLSQSNIEESFSDCPEVIAAYYEVANMMWEFQRSQSQPLIKMTVSHVPRRWSALLKIQVTIAHIIAATESDDPVGQIRELLLAPGTDGDVLTAVLEALPRILAVATASESNLAGLCQLYIDLCLATAFRDVQVLALHNLAEILDKLLSENKTGLVSSAVLTQLWTSLPLRHTNPALSSAIVTVSGCILAVLRSRDGASAQDVKAWGCMIADAGLDDKGFDTRFAAVQSLNSYLAFARSSCSTDGHLTALLALYDALNDDDDEVRDLASEAAGHVLGQALVPTEASTRLLQWLAAAFGKDLTFRAAVAGRIAGRNGLTALDEPWEAAEAQILRAQRFDDSLFVVEEQNLFVDEVRETKRWISVFEAISQDGQDSSLTVLDGWVRSGLDKMRELLQQEDGPLGWASHPDVFAICSRIVCAAAVLTRGHASEGLREDVDEIRQLLKSSKNHISLPLVAPLLELS